MKETFAELILYLQDNIDSYFWQGEFCEDSLASEIMAFSAMFEERIQ